MMDKRIIGSFCGLKVLALATIFYWHSMLPHRGVGDLGLHATQFFFVVSGFLVANRYWDDWMAGKCTIMGVLTYSWKKVKGIWPLHAVLLICLVVWNAASRCYTGCDWIQLLVSGLFLQAWTGALFAWNGPAWFVSALLFCYFVAPLLIGFVRKDTLAITLFFIVLGIRYGIECVQIFCPGKFWMVNYHGYPIIRCLEFYAGALMYPSYRMLLSHVRANVITRLIFTIFEMLALSLLFIWVIPNAFHQIRGSIVFSYCLFVFIFSFDQGYVSWFLGTKPFRALATIELPFFLLHSPMRTFLQPMFAWFQFGVYGSFCLWLMVTLLFGFIWQAVVARAYKISRVVYWALAMILLSSIFSVLLRGTYRFFTRMEIDFCNDSKSFLDKTECIVVFYSTNEKPEIWKQPILSLSIPTSGQQVYRCPTPKGLRQFRIEFRPKKGCKLGRTWPRINDLKIEGRDYSLKRLSPCYFEKGERPGFDGKIVD